MSLHIPDPGDGADWRSHSSVGSRGSGAGGGGRGAGDYSCVIMSSLKFGAILLVFQMGCHLLKSETVLSFHEWFTALFWGFNYASKRELFVLRFFTWMAEEV